MKKHLLLLDEAERGKWALTMEVVELHRTLEEQTAAKAGDGDQIDDQSNLAID